MRPVLASSSPASQGGTSTNTPATRITASAPNTVDCDNENATNDGSLAGALTRLTVNSQRFVPVTCIGLRTDLTASQNSS